MKPIPQLATSFEGVSRWRTPAGLIWQGEHNLTIGADPTRLRYIFYEDRMVFALTAPTDIHDQRTARCLESTAKEAVKSP